MRLQLLLFSLLGVEKTKMGLATARRREEEGERCCCLGGEEARCRENSEALPSFTI
jgi:hypothetical protein